MRNPQARLLLFLAAAAALLPARAQDAAPAPAPPRPNVLVLLADDASVRSQGFSGGAAADTPSLDALAANGVVLDGAVHQGGFSGAICTVSRAMILTGRPVWGVTPGRFGYQAPAQLDTADPLLPELFRGAGWQTFAAGKWHNGEAALRRGFERADAVFLGGMLLYNERAYGGVGDAAVEQGHLDPPLVRFDPQTGARLRYRGEGWSTDLVFDAAERFLREERDPARPFFAWVATLAPHDPRHAPREHLAAIDRDGMALPPNLSAEPTRGTGDLGVRDEQVLPPPRDEALHRREIAVHLAMMRHFDARAGRLLALLDELGLREDTLVLFTSDHGLSMGEHGLMGKQNLDEASWRVPLVVAGPGLPRGERRAGGAYLHGALPTLAELAGLAPPPHARAAAFTGLLRGEPDAGLARVFGAYTPDAGGEAGIRCVREGRWKLVRYLHSGEVDLFDLDADPWELRDLAEEPDQRARRARLEAVLQGWMDGSGDPQAR